MTITWYKNVHEDPENYQEMAPFDSIESVALNIRYQLFIKTALESNRIIKMSNGYSIDLKYKSFYKTTDIDNLEARRLIE